MEDSRLSHVESREWVYDHPAFRAWFLLLYFSSFIFGYKDANVCDLRISTSCIRSMFGAPPTFAKVVPGCINLRSWGADIGWSVWRIEWSIHKATLIVSERCCILDFFPCRICFDSCRACNEPVSL